VPDNELTPEKIAAALDAVKKKTIVPRAVIRFGAEDQAHKEILLNLEHFLHLNGYSNIKIALSGRVHPDEIKGPVDDGGNGHIPDATASLDGVQYIFEVEKDDVAIKDAHTESQMRLFSGHARKTGAIFKLVVPPEHGEAAEMEVKRLGLERYVTVLPMGPSRP
jgi:hypothetical protein